MDFGSLAGRHQESVRRRVRRRNQVAPWVILALSLLVGAAIVGGVAVWTREEPSLHLGPIDDQLADELATLELTAAVRNADDFGDRLRFTLDDGPDGAQIDPKTGELTWRPTEEQGPGSYDVTVGASVVGNQDLSARTQFTVHVREVKQPPVLEPIQDRTVELGGLLAFEVQAKDPDVPAKPMRFRLGPGAPRGARIDPHTGQFGWTPQTAKPGDVYEVTVVAQKAVRGGPAAETTFRVRIEAPSRPAAEDPELAIDQFVEQLQEEEVEVTVSGDALPHPPLAGESRWLSIDGKPVAVFGYGSAAEAQRDAGLLAPADLEEFTKAEPEPASAYVFRRDRLIAFYTGSDPTLLNLLDHHLGRPAVKKVVTAPAAETAADSADQRSDVVVFDLYDKHKLLSKTEYPTLRKVYAGRFEEEHEEEIRQGLGEPDGPMQKWLDEHVPIKEELYLAIDPAHDNVVRALQIFRELKEQFPEKLDSYASLAIAVAVVWDDERKSIHRSPSGQHQSIMPEGGLGPIENFQYFLETENVMQGRAQLLPWEFLVHLVNHRTPLAERQWALANYLPKRSMIGKCYNDVPYDGGKRGGEEPRMKDKLHTLPNIRQYGGVCTMRADYAARVAKCLGVPGFSVGGKSRYGEGHGWVMWVELGPVTRTGFAFSLESHGRFRGDRYYVGHLNDPHTGQRVSDRELELRLHAVGLDPIGKRHADLVMRCYPMLRERAEMSIADQLRFLSRVIDLSPGNEEAWIALAQMSREGLITKANSKPMMTVLDRLFTIFAKLPDFTWVVFDDLVSFQDIPEKRAALFGRLAAMYEQAGRPDLSCEARLKYAEYLAADERLEEAVRGLTAAILLFPEEGNFVPKMLDRLEELCGQVEGGPKHLVGLYQQLLPRIAQKRLNRPSPYCMKMYERGIRHFNEAGLGQLAQTYEMQLAMLKAMQPGQK